MNNRRNDTIILNSYSAVEVDKNYNANAYRINTAATAYLPKVLVFQG